MIKEINRWIYLYTKIYLYLYIHIFIHMYVYLYVNMYIHTVSLSLLFKYIGFCLINDIFETGNTKLLTLESKDINVDATTKIRVIVLKFFVLIGIYHWTYWHIEDKIEKDLQRINCKSRMILNENGKLIFQFMR
jgi:hypothetical protein